MTKFFFKFKKLLAHFWCIFPTWSKKSFSKKSDHHVQLHKAFYYHAQIQRHLMIQFQENIQTDSRTEEWTDPIS